MLYASSIKLATRFLLVTSLILVACAAPAPAPVAQPTQPAAAPQATQPTAAPQVATQPPTTLRLAGIANPTTLDPHKMTDVETQNQLWAFYETFTMLAPDGSVQPLLITDWEANGDATVWTLKVREGVTCHNGDSFDAEDVVYSMLRARDHPDTRRASYAAGFGPKDTPSIVAIDSHTVQVNSGSPYVLIPVDLGWIFATCKDYAESAGDEGLAQRPVGTGPFKFTEYQVGEFIKGERFDDYWGGPSDFADVEIRIIPNAAARVAALLAGEVDYVPAISTDEGRRIEQAAGFKAVNTPSNTSVFIMMDYTRPELAGLGGPNPLTDVRVRRAIYHAIDVESIVNNVMQGAAVVTTQFWLPFVRGHDPGIERLPYDPARAQELLAEAGHPNGIELTLDSTTGNHPNDSLVAEAIASMLTRAGIRSTPNVMPASLFSPHLQAGNSHLSLRTGGMGSLDVFSTADAFFFCNGRVNWMNSCVPEVDNMVKQANQIVDLPRREAMLQEANRLYHVEHVVTIPLYTFMGTHGVSERVNWTPAWAGYYRARDFSLPR